MSGAAPPPDGAPAAATILAPTSITRLSGQATEIRTKVWEITMGSAVPAWLEANGPTHVTNYNFVQSAGFKYEAHLVTRRPTEASTSQLQAKHDLSDLYDLTELGRGLLKVKPNKQTCSVLISLTRMWPARRSARPFGAAAAGAPSGGGAAPDMARDGRSRQLQGWDKNIWCRL